MVPFVYIMYELIGPSVGLLKALEIEKDPEVRRDIRRAMWVTIISWNFYPIVYLIPMFGIPTGTAVAAVQVGYSIADVMAKCGVGLLVYRVAVAKSKLLWVPGLGYANERRAIREAFGTDSTSNPSEFGDDYAARRSSNRKMYEHVLHPTNGKVSADHKVSVQNVESCSTIESIY
jgi:hypothetical protein